MICQQVLVQAEKQLVSLCVSLYPRLARCHDRQWIKRERQNALGYYQISRCFGSVPPPPPFVAEAESEIHPSCRNQEHQKKQNDERNLHEPEEKNDISITNEGEKFHSPVMVKKVLSCLEPKNDQLIVDMTFGAGGHARHILKSCPNVRYIGVDRDPIAYGFAKDLASNYRKGQIIPLLSKFSELPAHLEQLGVLPETVDCVLMDLGVSSMQFDSAGRGFALSKDGPLDMRMDGMRFPDSVTASDVVNTLEPHDLARILKKYGEEKKAKAIAHAIVEAKYAFGSFTRTKQLADVIKRVFESTFRHDKLHRHSHVATKTFQALRIFVNDEINELHNGLQVAHHILKPNGRCAVISFHSLEDRIVKRHFHGIDIDSSPNISIHDYLRSSNVSHDIEGIKEKYLTRGWLPLQRKILEPMEAEVNSNPRSRSAKLRAAIKVKQN